MIRRLVLPFVFSMLRAWLDEDTINAWLDPCLRYATARVLHKRAVDRGRDIAAWWWARRIKRLKARCQRMKARGKGGPEVCAADLAERAATNAIIDLLNRRAW